MKCKCGNPMQLELDSFTVASFFCCCGNRINLYRTGKGVWETSAERIDRLSVTRKCSMCGGTFKTISNYDGNYICPQCELQAEKKTAEYDWTRKWMAVSKHRNNRKSPWRIGKRIDSGRDNKAKRGEARS